MACVAGEAVRELAHPGQRVLTGTNGVELYKHTLFVYSDTSGNQLHAETETHNVRQSLTDSHGQTAVKARSHFCSQSHGKLCEHLAPGEKEKPCQVSLPAPGTALSPETRLGPRSLGAL